MLSTPRRGISYPDPNRTDEPDVAIHIGNVATAADTAAIYAKGTKAARPAAAIEGKFYVATDTTPHQLSYDEGSQWLDIQVGSQFGTRVARPAVGSVPVGSFYYATDQIALYLNDGSAWIRVSDQPGDIIWTLESTQRTGYLICTGQAWPATTGIYADLFAKLGGQYPTVLPDMQGREFVAKGTHADINTIGFVEPGSLGASSRRPRHASSFALTVADHLHSIFIHTFTYVTSVSGSGTSFTTAGGQDHGGLSFDNSVDTKLLSYEGALPAIPGTIGMTSAAPTDSGAYITLQPQVKL